MMTRGAAIDLNGTEVTEEEAAKHLGFVNVEAYREWHRTREMPPHSQLMWCIGELANLHAEMVMLKDQIARVEQMLIDTGTIRIGGCDDI